MLLKGTVCYTAFSEFYIKWHVAFMVDFIIFFVGMLGFCAFVAHFVINIL